MDVVDFRGVTCGPCVAELPRVREAVEHFAGTDRVTVGLHESGDTVKDLAAFAARHGLTYRLAVDRPAGDSGGFGTVFATSGVRSIPAATVIARRGQLAFVGRFTDALAMASTLRSRTVWLTGRWLMAYEPKVLTP